MTLEATFKALNTHLRMLHGEFSGLRTTIREDKPIEGDVVFVDMFGDTMDDLLGRLEEMLTAAQAGQQTSAQQLDLSRAWRILATCQEQFNHLQYQFFDLISYNRLAPLVYFGGEQGGEWRAWVNSVKEMLDRCQQPLYDVNQVLFQCWQEIAERVDIRAMSVQTTNIGQQIAVPESWDMAR